jgi:hypothetical protein
MTPGTSAMRVCMRIVDFVEQAVERWVEMWITQIQQVCHDVVRQIESWEQQWQQQWVEQSKRVCRWLPWPLDAICGWVTELVAVWVQVWVKIVTSVVETICTAVTSLVRVLIKIVTTVIVSVVRIVCFVIGFVAGWIEIIVWGILGIPEFLLCLLGLRIRKHLHVCVTVLADRQGRPVVDDDAVTTIIADAAKVLSDRFNVRLHEHGRKHVRVDEKHLTVIACDSRQLFGADATDLSGEAEHVGRFADLLGCSENIFDLAGEVLQGALNVIFVRDIVEGDDIGCHIPGTDYVIVDRSAAGLTLAHEIGHAGDLWHVSETKNLMNHITIGDTVRAWQVCIFRRSRFVVYAP